MCGIVAVVARDLKASVDADLVGRMTERLHHRGPDDGGVFMDGPVGLGHRRLSVLDLATGKQPMFGPSGATCIVFNGEIFNYVELRETLQRKGVRFRTTSDTEVILALYEDEGPSFVSRLNGMFAFAIWDQRRQSLLLARDRVGIKPLYIWEGPGVLAVASEIKSLLLVPGVPRRIREGALPEFLAFRHLGGYRTLFDGIEAFPPGTVRIVSASGVRSQVYWRPQPEADAVAGATRAGATGDLRALLEDAVRMQLVSDVPLGSFNSGGIDSSIVTALASRHVVEPMQSFSVGFEDAAWDERPFARALAQHVGTVHQEIVANGEEFATRLPRVAWCHDQPLNHANSVFIAMLSEFARRKVTVVLTGEGADELFAGYPRYKLAQGLDRLRRFAPFLERLLAIPVGFARSRKARMLIDGLGASGERVIAANARFVFDDEASRLVTGDCVARRIGEVPPGRDILTRLRAHEIGTYLHSVLERMDKMTMSVGLEARVPFLDPRVVDFALSLPSDVVLPGFVNKAVVRDVARDLVPVGNIERPKSGFGVPVGDWMRGNGSLAPYLEMLTDRRSLDRGFFDAAGLTALVAEHRAGTDRSEVLWAALNCELWARIFLDGTGEPPGASFP